MHCELIVFLSKYYVWSLFLCFSIPKLTMYPFVNLVLAEEIFVT